MEVILPARLDATPAPILYSYAILHSPLSHLLQSELHPHWCDYVFDVWLFYQSNIHETNSPIPY